MLYPHSMDEVRLIATTAVGLEAVARRELSRLGYAARGGDTGRVHFSADVAAICRANLWLRSADRVLLVLDEFQAVDFGELYDRTLALPWEDWIPEDGSFPVKGRSVRSTLSSVPACQRIVKKAIVDRLMKAHRSERLEETGARFVVEVALLKDRATLTLDTTGAGLNRRGYRTLVGAAQLRETLAAALIQLTYWRPDRPFIDPFCGTGTLPIEAALLGRNIAPGLSRGFDAEHWPAVPRALWETAREEARDLIQPDLPVRIIGTDQDPRALSLARYHAEQAGVAEQIHFQQRTFAELTSSARYGCLVCNPPYGERLGDHREVRELYASMPDVFRRLPTWSIYVLSADPDFERLVGRRADRRRKLYNARIECQFFQFHGPRPGAGDAIEPDGPRLPQQAFGGLAAGAKELAEQFGNRLKKRARHLRRWPSRRGITCYRLYGRDIPEVPLAVDFYEGRLHIAEYERPHDRSPAEHLDWLDLMAETAARVLEIPRELVFLKTRRRQKGGSQHGVLANEHQVFVVSEGGLKFEVNLSDYIDTGLFLDHRLTRQWVRERSRGRRMLNLFAYTGSFSVYAADGGAVSTTSVDLSNTYLDWAERNLRQNGFTGGEHRSVREDVLEFLERHNDIDRYDLIVADVPTFSNSKRTDEVWDVQWRHVELINRLLELLSGDGELLFSTNYRKFRLFEKDLRAGRVEDLTGATIPEDFRDQKIHKCWRIGR